MPILIQHPITVRRIGQQISQLLLVLAERDFKVEEELVLGLYISMRNSGIMTILWGKTEEENTDARHLGTRGLLAYVCEGFLHGG